MFHQIQIVGALGKDVELRYMPTGTGVANLSVAANHTYKKGDETVKQTIWFRVSVFGRQAETCNQYLHKGSKVLIIGRLNADEKGNPKVFTRQDGTSGAAYEVVADTVKFLDGREYSDDQPAQGSEDDVPF